MKKIFIRRLRFWTWWLHALLLKHFIKVAVSVVLIALASWLFFQSASRFAASRNVYTEGVVGQYTVENLPDAITLLISRGLTKVGDKLAVGADLADWQVTDDGKIYTFTLKDNLYSHDNKPVKTTDLNLRIEGAEIVYLDEKTIQFKLADQFAPFPTLLSKPVFKKGGLVGIGPYKIGKIGESGGFVKNIRLESLQNNLPHVVFRFYPNFSQAVVAFKQGEIAAISGLNLSDELISRPNTQIFKTSNKNIVIAILYNTRDEFLATKDVRRALDLAIDRTSFDESLADSSISNQSWAYNNTIETPKQDLSQAKKLLEEVQNKSSRVVLTVTPIWEELAGKIAANWAELGIETEVKVENSIPENFQALLTGIEIPADPDQYSYWHSTQSTNLTSINSAKIDKLLEDGRKAQDLEERKDIYFEFQKVLLQELPASFLFYPERYYLINKNALPKLEQLKKVFPSFPFH